MTQLLPSEKYDSRDKNIIAAYLTQAKIVCTTVDALLKYKLTMEEVYKFEGFCDALTEGRIKNDDSSLDTAKKMMEQNCEVYLPFLDANGMNQPEDNEVDTCI